MKDALEKNDADAIKKALQMGADKGVHVDLIKLYGSMELAPLTGLADLIVDQDTVASDLEDPTLVLGDQLTPIPKRHLVGSDDARQAALTFLELGTIPLSPRWERQGDFRQG